MKTQKLVWIGLVALVLFSALTGCAGQTKPTVMIVSQVASSTIVENQDVAIQAGATDAKGITRIELAVDSDVTSIATIDPPQKSVMAPLTWKATSGQHTLSVRALNVDNVMSDPAFMTVNVAHPAPGPATVVPPATIAAPPTVPGPTAAATAAPQPVACVPNAAFVADVTVPDGTQWFPNQSFNKIWRIKNTGNCAWPGTYQFVHVGGEAMSSASVIAVPATPAGGTADFAIPMIAPATLGRHQGSWQLRDQNGTLFGATVHVTINVISPAAPPQALLLSPANGFQVATGVVRVTFQGNGNTELSSVALYINGTQVAKQTSRAPVRQITGTYDWQPAPGNYDLYVIAVDILNQSTTSAHVGGTVSSACTPSINFRADRTTINVGEHTYLRWDLECIKSAYLDGQGVAGHDARDVAPTSTHTYTLRVNKIDGGYEDRQVTINVNSPVPPPPPPPQRRNLTGTWDAGQYSMQLSEALGCPGPSCGVSGEYSHYTGGTPDLRKVSGSVDVYSGAVSLTMPGSMPGQSSVQFNGTLSADSRTLSGTLTGVGSITFTKE